MRDARGKIVDFRFVFLNTAAASVMRVQAGRVRRPQACTDVLPRAWDDRARFDMYVEALETQRGAADRAAVRSRRQPQLVPHRRVAARRRPRGLVRRHHAAQAAGTRAARGRSAQGRIPRDAGARAAQSAGADPPGRDHRAQRERDRRAEALVQQRHRAPGAAHVAAARRSARRLAHHARHAAAAQAADRPAIDRRRRGGNRAAAHRRAAPPARRRRARQTCR